MSVNRLLSIKIGDEDVFVISFSVPSTGSISSSRVLASHKVLPQRTTSGSALTPEAAESPTAASDSQPEKKADAQKFVSKQLRIFQGAFYPFVIIKTGLIIFLGVLFWSFSDRTKAQLDVIYRLSIRSRLLCRIYVAKVVMYNLDDALKLYSKLTFTKPQLAAILYNSTGMFFNLQATLLPSFTSSEPIWKDSLYPNWNSTSTVRNASLEPFLNVSFPTPTASVINMTLTGFCYYYSAAANVYAVSQDAPLFNYLANIFVHPFTSAVFEVQKILPIFAVKNGQTFYHIQLITGITLAFLVGLLVVVVFFLKRIVQVISSTYLSFAYLTDHDLQTILDRIETFRSCYHFEKQPLIQMEKPSLISKPTFSHRNLKVPIPNSNPCEQRHLIPKHSEDQNSEAGNSRRELQRLRSHHPRRPEETDPSLSGNCRIKLQKFQRDLRRRDFLLLLGNLSSFIVPLFIFGVFLNSSFTLKRQCEGVFGFHSQLTGYKANLAMARVLAVQRYFNLTCDDCVYTLETFSNSLLSQVPSIITGATELLSYGVTEVSKELTLLDSEFCDRATLTGVYANSTWLGLCAIYPVLTKGIATVMVQTVQDMILLPESTDFEGRKYFFMDLQVVIQQIQAVFERLEKFLGAEYETLLSAALSNLTVIIVILYVLSLLCYLVFWLWFARKLEQGSKERQLILRILESSVTGNPHLTQWLLHADRPTQSKKMAN